jgi:hypothetical protein
MTTRVSLFSGRYLPVPVADAANDCIAVDYFYDLPTAQNILNDIIDIGVLPAGHTVSDAILLSDDLDSNGTPLMALDVGIMSGTPGDPSASRTCGNELFAADTAVRTGASSRMTKVAGFNILPTDTDRSIGVKIQAAAATAAAGRIRLRVWMHAADRNVQF